MSQSPLGEAPVPGSSLLSRSTRGQTSQSPLGEAPVPGTSGFCLTIGRRRLNRLSAKPRSRDLFTGFDVLADVSQSPLGEAPVPGRRVRDAARLSGVSIASRRSPGPGRDGRKVRASAGGLNRLSAKPRSRVADFTVIILGPCLNRLSAKPRSRAAHYNVPVHGDLSQSPLGEAPVPGRARAPLGVGRVSIASRRSPGPGNVNRDQYDARFRVSQSPLGEAPVPGRHLCPSLGHK